MSDYKTPAHIEIDFTPEPSITANKIDTLKFYLVRDQHNYTRAVLVGQGECIFFYHGGRLAWEGKEQFIKDVETGREIVLKELNEDDVAIAFSTR